MKTEIEKHGMIVRRARNHRAGTDWVEYEDGHQRPTKHLPKSYGDLWNSKGIYGCLCGLPHCTGVKGNYIPGANPFEHDPDLRLLYMQDGIEVWGS